jgi:uncharacterized protein
VREFSVNIVGLSNNKSHQFNFELKDEFFRDYGSDLVPGGQFTAAVALNKHETFIEADFKIKGKANLVCDRSLESFEYPIAIDKKIVFKYGHEEGEVSDEIVIIGYDRTSLELGQYMYEFIGLEIPIKKLHPKFQEDEGDDNEGQEGKLIYSSATTEDKDEEEQIDPRWEKLKKLK